MNKFVYSTNKTQYEILEQQSTSRYTRLCINGETVGCSKCVGYCQFNGHPGFLTEKLRKQRDCIAKQCFYYIAKERRQKPKTKDCNITEKDLLNEAKEKTKAYEGMRILYASETSYKNWTLKYITISNEYPFEKIAERIGKTTGYKINLERLNYSFDICTKILFETV